MKYAVHFDLKHRTNHEGSSFIRLRVSFSGNRIEMLTGLTVADSRWDSDKEHMRPSRKEPQASNELNGRLDDIRHFIRQTFTRFELDSKTPSKDDIGNALRSYFGTNTNSHNNNTSFDLFDSFDQFMTTIGTQNAWSLGTVKKFRTLKNHLREWQPRLEFDDLSEQNLQEFVRFLYGKQYRNTYVRKILSNLRAFLSWAKHNGRTTVSDFETFRPKLRGSDGSNKEIIYLDFDELLSIYNLDLRQYPTLDAVRDVFCFCCFTGLRYSDAANLRPSDVRQDSIVVVTQKTSDHLEIELNDYSRAILAKYRGETFQCGHKNGLCLPVLSNQKMNAHLKEIAFRADIYGEIRQVYFSGSKRIETVTPKWKLITTHCARRTFVTSCLRLGIASEVVMKWTGHSNFSAMQPYAAIVPDLRRENMEKLNNIPQKFPKSDSAKYLKRNAHNDINNNKDNPSDS